MKNKLGCMLIMVAMLVSGLLLGNVQPIYANSNSINTNNSYTLASTETAPATDGKDITAGTDIPDLVLYDRLERALRTVKGRAIKENLFWDFEVLDLSGNENTSSKIKSLEGLDKLDFRSLKVIKINYNDIKTIDANVFRYMRNLQTIEIVGSNLQSIDLSKVNTLRNINLSNNQIDEIKLNKMIVDGSSYVVDGHYDKKGTAESTDDEWVTTTTTKSVINLSNNQITKFTDIKLPEDLANSSCDIILYNNYITDYDGSLQHMTINLGLQGLSTVAMHVETIDDEEHYYLFKSSKIVLYNLGDDKWEIKLTRNYKENNVDLSEVITLKDSPTSDKAEYTLDNGNYSLDVYYDGNIFDYRSDNTYGWQPIEFKVIPSTPTYYYTVKGVRYDELTILDQVTTINFGADQGATIYYKMSTDKNWTKGNTLKITKGGYQTIYVKSVDGNYESQERMIVINAASNLRIPSLLIIMLVVVGGLVVGFIGLPLIRKYIIRQ